MSTIKKIIIFDLVTFFISLIFGLLATIFQETLFIVSLLEMISMTAFIFTIIGALLLLIAIIAS